MMLGTKIVMDDSFREDDLCLYNELYAHIPSLKEGNSGGYKPQIEERLHGVVAKIFGDRMSRRIVVAIKNMYGYYEIYRIRKDLKI